ncbi:hypothetical protein D3C74_294380 [compost metagenome]
MARTKPTTQEMTVPVTLPPGPATIRQDDLVARFDVTVTQTATVTPGVAKFLLDLHLVDLTRVDQLDSPPAGSGDPSPKGGTTE